MFSRLLEKNKSIKEADDFVTLVGSVDQVDKVLIIMIVYVYYDLERVCQYHN